MRHIHGYDGRVLSVGCWVPTPWAIGCCWCASVASPYERKGRAARCWAHDMTFPVRIAGRIALVQFSLTSCEWQALYEGPRCGNFIGVEGVYKHALLAHSRDFFVANAVMRRLPTPSVGLCLLLRL